MVSGSRGVEPVVRWLLAHAREVPGFLVLTLMVVVLSSWKVTSAFDGVTEPRADDRRPPQVFIYADQWESIRSANFFWPRAIASCSDIGRRGKSFRTK